ncbi:MAG: glutamate mutase L [Anaerolineales bacterium]
MTSSLVSADSLLAIDIGPTATRALLFDVVDGRYQFLAAGSAVTTAGAPYFNVGEGVRQALDHLQEISGRLLLRNDESIIIPSATDGSGVDAVAATISAGPPLSVVAIGLLEDVSLESARRLAETTYAEVVETLSLNDRRKQDERLDLILRTRPDLVIAAGGTENGADQSIKHLIETVGLACNLLPQEMRPQVLYAGNKDVRGDIRSILEGVTPVYFAPNIRPNLEIEQLDPAQSQLAQIYRQISKQKIAGVQEIDRWSKGMLMPTATAFGRMIRFLSTLYDPAKGVLGFEISGAAATIASGFSGKLNMGVYPDLGLGVGLPGIMKHTKVEKIARWLSVDLNENDVLDYIYQKAANPASIPTTVEEMALEQALIREIMRISVKLAATGFPEKIREQNPGQLPWFEPILARGMAFQRSGGSPGKILMALLDGMQPTGVTTLLLDQSNLAASLGAAAAINPTLVVQVIEANMLNLGAVISPVGNARPGTPILRLQATFEDGNETKLEIKYGRLEVLPVPLGQTVTLRLQPLHRFDIGMGGPGRGGRLRMVGGVLGLIIDARGRPITLHSDASRRRELLNKWLWTLGN